jgi:hypothetical protein
MGTRIGCASRNLDRLCGEDSAHCKVLYVAKPERYGVASLSQLSYIVFSPYPSTSAIALQSHSGSQFERH